MTVFVSCAISVLIPLLLQFAKSIREKNLDGVMECIPIMATLFVSVIKLLNHNIKRKEFENFFDRMSEQWEISELNGEIHVLNEIIEQGSKMGTLYRISLWVFMIIFLSTPLAAPALDLISRSNESRTKMQLFKLNYIVDTEDYFYIVYIHLTCCSLATVLVIIAMDSLYMVIFHYICGVFVLCGYQIKKATEISKSDIEGGTFENSNKKDLFRRCVMTHYEAIKFYDYMNDSTRTSYLFQVGLNMLGITSTAVQAVMNFDRPEEAFRIIMFLLGQQFHLYTLSLPGQVLMDRSFELSNDIYCSKWHEIPVKFQKVLHIMLTRSSKPCRLSAGGLYEMNIENFGTIFKTCMSYFTILLSLRE
uniref:odorant receptor 49a-like n=1 Tax=Osmia lignaria TaxID=473952 RepID=UPI0014783A23|nr:odorant receptor 49a-like [Osmia lignaria]